MTVKRFGEGPSWMGGGKSTPCILELSGKRMDSFSAVPRAVKRLVDTECLPFLMDPAALTGPSRRQVFSTNSSASDTGQWRWLKPLRSVAVRNENGDLNAIKAFRSRSDLLDAHFKDAAKKKLLRIFP
jgi:hypothetical protein